MLSPSYLQDFVLVQPQVCPPKPVEPPYYSIHTLHLSDSASSQHNLSDAAELSDSRRSLSSSRRGRCHTDLSQIPQVVAVVVICTLPTHFMLYPQELPPCLRGPTQPENQSLPSLPGLLALIIHPFHSLHPPVEALQHSGTEVELNLINRDNFKLSVSPRSACADLNPLGMADCPAILLYRSSQQYTQNVYAATLWLSQDT